MNYLTLMSDGLRGDFANNPDCTPNLHAFFEKYGGDKFTNAYSTTNWTFASMMSFHSGLLPSKNGMWDITYGKHAGRLEAREIEAFKATECVEDDFLLAKLKKTGYNTKYVGEHRMWTFLVASVNYLYDTNSFYDFQYMQMKTWREEKFKEPFFLFAYDQDGGHDPWGVFERDSQIAVKGVTFRGDCLSAFQGNYIRSHKEEFPISRLYQLYGDQVRQYDKKLKEFLKWFVDSGLYKNTALFFFADHGESLWEHPDVIGHAVSLYEEEIHIPLFVYYPSSRNSRLREISDPVSFVDIMPTVLGVETLADGVNLFVRRRTRPIFFEFTRYKKEKNIEDEWKILPSPDDFIRGIRLMQYKLLYIRNINGEVITELYNLSEKNKETKENRIKDSKIEKFLMGKLVETFNIDAENLQHVGRLENVVKMQVESGRK